MSSLYWLIEENFQKINPYTISRNPSAIEFLERHPEKIDWRSVPNIGMVKDREIAC